MAMRAQATGLRRVSRRVAIVPRCDWPSVYESDYAYLIMHSISIRDITHLSGRAVEYSPHIRRVERSNLGVDTIFYNHIPYGTFVYILLDAAEKNITTMSSWLTSLKFYFNNN